MSVNANQAWKLAPVISALPLALGILFIFLAHRVTAEAGHTARPFLVQLTIIIPEIIIWLIATASAVRFKQYALAIKNNPDGQSLDYIAKALLFMVVYIILLTTASTVVNLFKNASYLPVILFMRNHLPVAVALGSVVYLYRGSHKLNQTIKATVWTRQRLTALIALSTILFAFFAWNFYTVVPDLEPVNGIPRFTLPASVLLITYVLPHIVLWFVGMVACINLSIYAANTPGKLYKRLFRDLFRGILLVYVCIFIAQLLIISSIILAGFSLGLLIIYAVLILATAGFVLIHRGAKQLHDIEQAT